MNYNDLPYDLRIAAKRRTNYVVLSANPTRMSRTILGKVQMVAREVPDAWFIRFYSEDYFVKHFDSFPLVAQFCELLDADKKPIMLVEYKEIKENKETGHDLHFPR